MLHTIRLPRLMSFSHPAVTLKSREVTSDGQHENKLYFFKGLLSLPGELRKYRVSGSLLSATWTLYEWKKR